MNANQFEQNPVEARLMELKIHLPYAPKPLGAYVETVQTGNLLFLSGILPIENKKPKYLGVIGKDLTIDDGRDAARVASLNALAAAKEHLGSLDRVSRVVRLAVSVVATNEFKNHAQVADGASELLLDVFGKEKMSTRMVYGTATLPMGVPVVVEILLEVQV